MDREALAGDTYFNLRGRMFYFERRVPAHRVSAIGRTHFRESLKTADQREARRLRNLRAAEIERQFFLQPSVTRMKQPLHRAGGSMNCQVVK